MVNFCKIKECVNSLCSQLKESDPDVLLTRILLRHVSDHISKIAEALLSEYGINWVSYIAMIMLISSRGEPLNPSALAEATGESKANITRICDELVEKNLLLRTPNMCDRRCIDLFLSEKGKILAKDVFLKIQKQSLGAMGKITKKELSTLKNILMKMQDNPNQ